jgi:hypothetical protein
VSHTFTFSDRAMQLSSHFCSRHAQQSLIPPQTCFRSPTVRNNSIATIYFGRGFIEGIVAHKNPQYIMDKKEALPKLHEVLSVKYQAVVLYHDEIYRIMAPYPLPPGQMMGDPLYHGRLVGADSVMLPSASGSRRAFSMESTGSATDAEVISDDEMPTGAGAAPQDQQSGHESQCQQCPLPGRRGDDNLIYCVRCGWEM